jgi:AhpD family alkylhydroperoxidase
VHLRASQINGCSACVDSGWRSARKAGETDERLSSAAAWREAPYYTDAERAALALTDERGLATLLLMIGITNVFNRINVATRRPAGSWGSRPRPVRQAGCGRPATRSWRSCRW